MKLLLTLFIIFMFFPIPLKFYIYYYKICMLWNNKNRLLCLTLESYKEESNYVYR